MSASYIAAHLTHLRAAGRAQRTIADRAELLDRVDADLPHGLIRAATPEIQRWLARFSGWTLCTYDMHLRGFFRHATAGDAPWLDWNPMADMPSPRRPRRVPDPVTDDELASALAGSGPWWRRAVLLAAYAGLRASEIARLMREDVCESSLRVWGKGDVGACLPTHPLVWAAVVDLPPGPLFITPHGLQATGRWLSAKARYHFDRLGLFEVHMQRFRHWFGTMIQERYGDIRLTQELMRHASPVSTAGYTQVTGERRAQAVAALPVLMGRSVAGWDAASS